MRKDETNYLKEPISLSNERLNDNTAKEMDTVLPMLLKDLDGNIKYMQVLSQDDYNVINPSNDTLYFINNVAESAISISNILDVAIGNNSVTNPTPKDLWILTVDRELEKVTLWKGSLKKKAPLLLKIVKEFLGYVDGCITFDGTYEYSPDFSEAYFITMKEPFIFLINYKGELHAFPNLKYKTDSPIKKNNGGMILDGGTNGEVKVCSAERGYCSNYLREEDQGLIVAYTIKTSTDYELRYRRYGYISNSSMVKIWGEPSRLCVRNEEIFNVAIRRLSDYRVGITCNYWEVVNNERRIAAEFWYSNRTTAGIAYHPEVLSYNQSHELAGPILYGVTRDDDIKEILKPYLSLVKIQGTKDGQVRLIFGLYKEKIPLSEVELQGLQSGNYSINSSIGTEVIEGNAKREPVNIEILFDETENTDNILSAIGLEVINTFPFRQYTTDHDPVFGHNVNALAKIVEVFYIENFIYITLEGSGLPLTPFSIVPITDWAEKQINVRFLADQFNDEELRETNASGWFALSEINGFEYVVENKEKINHTDAFSFQGNKDGAFKRITPFKSSYEARSTNHLNITFYSTLNNNYNKSINYFSLNTITTQKQNTYTVTLNGFNHVCSSIMVQGGNIDV